MRTVFSFALLLVAGSVMAQAKPAPTDAFTIDGRVKHPLHFSIDDLKHFPVKDLPDLVITDHTGAVKHTLTHLKGILLKDILAEAEPDAESPKVLSAYFYVLSAPDNYKVVYSWNEIFNSATGSNVYIVMEEGGKKITEMDNRIATVTMTDIRTGRRHMSNLSRITVYRAP